MNGIHEVRGSNPLWSTISLTFVRDGDHRVLRHAADPAGQLAGTNPLWSTHLRHIRSVNGDHRVLSTQLTLRVS